jgi:hypothetical protein
VLESQLRDQGAVTLRGGDFDRWDLKVGVGIFGCACLRMAIEEHGAGRQLVRFRLAPRWPGPTLAMTLLFLTLAVTAGVDRSSVAAAILGASALALPAAVALKQAAAMGHLVSTLEPRAADHPAAQAAAPPSPATTEAQAK